MTATARSLLAARLRKLDDTPHDRWPRWTYRDMVAVHEVLASAPESEIDVERLARVLSSFGLPARLAPEVAAEYERLRAERGTA